MKTIKILFFIVSTALFISCEKEIDLDLDEADQLFVVEGIVHDSLGDNYVNISKTRPFDNNEAIEKVSNAIVQITDNVGNTYSLNEVTPGYYTNTSLIGVAGRTYNLNVNIDGEVITASSLMSPRTEIDSLSFREQVGFGGPDSEKEYSVYFHFKDSLNFENFYRIKAFLGDQQKDGFVNISDDFIDGSSTFFPVFEVSYLAGETATIQLLSVDEVNFRYFSALYLSQGGDVPGNPETNLSGDKAVGYFGAYAKSEKSILINP